MENTSSSKKAGNGKMKRTDKTANKRALRYGSYSIAVVCVAVALVIFANLIMSMLPSSSTLIDTSANNMFTLGDETKEIVSAVSEKVTIYIVVQSGSEKDDVCRFAERYADLSPNVTVEYVDPVVRPSFVSSYTDDTLDNNSLIVVSGKRSSIIAYNDLYYADTSNVTDEEMYYYYYYGQYPSSIVNYFVGESKITTAIDYVTTDVLPVVYQLTGHGETALSDTMTGYIDAKNISLSELSLITEDLPEDCDCIVINAPKYDISDAELEILLGYIADGGGLLVTTGYEQSDFANLKTLAAAYGIILDDGLVVESNRSYYNGYNYYIIPTLSSHDITSPLISESRIVILPFSHGMTVAETLPDGVTVSTLLSSSSSSFEPADPYTSTAKQDGDGAGPYAVGVAAESGDGKVVWFSSTYITNDSIDSWVSGADSSLYVNSLAWISGKTDAISINGTVLTETMLTVSDSTASVWKVITIFLIPAAVLVTGIAVFAVRKRR